MKLAHPIFDGPIIFKENEINILVVENRREFVRLINGLISQSKGAEGAFVLSDDDLELSFSETDIITDVFKLEVNSRKNLNKLLAALEETALDENFYEQSCDIMGKISSYAANVAAELDYNLDLSEIKLSDVFKLCGVRFDFEDDNLCSAIMDYLKVSHDISGIRLFVFVNLKQILDSNELESLYKNIIYNKYNVLMLESCIAETKLNVEKYKIIDKDLCEIA